ncbi:divergent PAP2 family protein [Acetivibrio thermocellus]|uniref:divergent PAP2 family protein n=1 Tax=Acetivibrio thermocellus TaxID=1515 RepID=UPI0003B83550|nr:divergent PAP2 family protein [Acetivibrio thermocellus]UWV48338.1 divergent PAP2 family protein [Acetivibrio thermocellus]CDG35522.1 acid phosphatase/vanadium-dependent haloperoxidase-like protein [Acetivibrio thermocellus BC1]
MKIVYSILSNKTVTVPMIAWFVAQFLKVVNVIVVERKLDFTRFIGSGGMPSSHSSFIVSLATVVGKMRGLDSVEFGISAAVAAIVMYDAAGVRRAAGKQAKVLNKLIFSQKEEDRKNFDENLKELIGHSPFEVFVGAMLGMLIGLCFA